MAKQTIAPIKSSDITLGQRIKKELVTNWEIYILALPVIAYYLIFCYGPMFGILMAFKSYEPIKGIFGSKWVGMKHFIEFFSGEYFVRTMRNTLLISFYMLIYGFPAPVIFALLLNEIKSNKYKKTIQMITYLPHFVSMVVMCGIIVDFFSSRGIITKLISVFGGELKNYMGDAKYFRAIYVGTGIWQSIGWNSIIYIAALAGIDQQLYEAAMIDGAGRFRQMISVTLPGIASTIVIMLILQIGQMLNVGYEKIILLYNDATMETADVISSYVYRRGLGEGMNYSYSTAVGLFQSVVNIILVVSANNISRKVGETSLF